MHAHPRFKLSREAALALVVSSALSCMAGAAGAAQVARVQFATGQVSATGTDGAVRALGRGAAVVEGDTVNTEQGRAQLQFTDGASVSLQPRTTFRIDQFRFSGKNDGEERGFFSLVRGGLRTITGLIGRDNRSAYRVTTTTATIGIRGTEYLADVTGSLRVAVGGGTIAIANDAGTFIIEQGQSAYVADAKSAPVITFEKPLLPPPGSEEAVPPIAGTQNPPMAERLGPAVTIPPLDELLRGSTPPPVTPEPPVTNVAGVGSFGLDASLFLSSGTATLNSANQVTTFTDPATGEKFEQGTTSVKDSFYDGIVGVGRWSEGTFKATVNRGSGLEALSVPVGANQGLQYAFGNSIPATMLPTMNIATYTQLAATQATSTTGALGLGTFAPGQGAGQPIMAVDFASGKIGMDFSVTFPSAAYRVQTSGGIGGLASSEVSLLGPAAPLVFANSSAIPTMAIAGTACTGAVTCSTDVLGFLAGTTGERSGFTYEIDDPSRGLNIHGAAAGTQSEIYLPTSAAAVFSFADSSTSATSVAANGTAYVTPTGRMTMFSGSDCCDNVTMAQLTARFATGESGYDGTIGFGRLTGGRADIDGGEGAGFSALNMTANQGLHYVFGALTNPMPASGFATYNLLGATKATSESGALGLGTFSGSLAVDFLLGRVGVAFNVNFGGANIYSVTTTGGVSNVRSSEVSLGSPQFFGSGLPTTNPAACADGCSAAVEGFFAGDNAVRAGLGYRIFDLDERVVGAATFTQSGFTPPPAGGALVGTGLTLNYAGAHDIASFGSSDAFNYLGTSGSVDSTGNLINIFEGAFTTIGTASPAPGETGNDGIIGWSRWVNGTLGGSGSHAGGTLAGTQSFHNVFGSPTPGADMTALQVGNVTATYALLGATKPTTDAAGALPGTLSSASLTANFGTGTATFNAALTVNAVGYNINAGGLPIAGSGFGGSGGFTTGAGCSSGSCSTSVHGFFAGAMAARAGVAYNIQNSSGNFINGATALTKTSPP